MHELRDLFRMTGGLKRFLILLLLRCPFGALYTIVQASFLQYSFNAINHGSMEELYLTCALFGIGCLLIFLYNGTVWTQFSAFVIKWVAAMRRKLYGHISGLSLQQIESKVSGEWFTRLNADVQCASAILNQSIHLPHAAVSIVNICVSSLILVTMNPAIFVLVLLFLIPHMLISWYFVIKPMTKLSMDIQQETDRNTTDLNAIVTCADIALLYNAQYFLLESFEESSRNLRKANMRVKWSSAIGNGLLPLIGMSGYLVILLVGSVWISAGTMTFGDLTASFQYRGEVLSGTMMFISSLINIKTALAGVKRVNETMQIRVEEKV